MATSQPTPPQSKTLINPFNIIHAILILLGSGGSLLLRVYFIHGGHRLWLSSLLQIAGWPILFIPILLSPKKSHLSFSLIVIFSLLGLLFALDCYLYTLASAFLPLSTSSLLIASHLAFTAMFAFLIVRQKFTPYSLNAVVLLTMGSVVLSLGSGSDRPEGESKGKYFLGFGMAIAASALIGLIFPLMEFSMRRGKVVVSYMVTMEMQLVMGVAGTCFCLVGMAINKDFQVIHREARQFGLGETKYYMVLIWDAICWELINVGSVGLISGASSLFVGIMTTFLLPLSEVLSVIFLHEKFNGSKGIALVLSIWGFVSYLYGEKKLSDEQEKQSDERKDKEGLNGEVELP
ncbi:hypothetical protein LUZ60_005714 [Juncus effusus]|nr:hypothetical protein LUZ60_005714 [Juncus effusus]